MILGGTNVSLPNNQLLSPDITVDGTNTVFTVATAGRYRLAYNVNLTAAVALGARLLINGTAAIGSTIAPNIALASFENENIIDLAAGSTVTLQLYGLLGAATLLGSGVGSSLSIIRLS